MDAAFLVVLNTFYMAQPAVEMALQALVEDPARSGADLRQLKAACCTLKEDANTLVALLIARPSDEDMLTEAEVLFRYFEQVEAQIAEMIAIDQPHQ